MYCIYCGNQMNDTNRFCPRCGKPVLKPQDGNAAQNPPQNTPQNPQQTPQNQQQTPSQNAPQQTPAQQAGLQQPPRQTPPQQAYQQPSFQDGPPFSSPNKPKKSGNRLLIGILAGLLVVLLVVGGILAARIFFSDNNDSGHLSASREDRDEDEDEDNDNEKDQEETKKGQAEKDQDETKKAQGDQNAKDDLSASEEMKDDELTEDQDMPAAEEAEEAEALYDEEAPIPAAEEAEEAEAAPEAAEEDRRSDSESGSSDNRPDSNHNTSSDAAIGNGTNVVRYGGKLFYWSMTFDDVSDTGTFGNYYYLGNAVSDLVCENPDGSERQVIYTGNGHGKLAIGGGRIYFNASDSDNEIYSGLYSMAMDGTDVILIEGNGVTIEGADDISQTLIYTTGYGNQGLHILDLNSGQVQSMEKGAVGLIRDRKVYYYVTSEEEGVTTIKVMNTDGSDDTELCKTPTLSEIYGDDVSWYGGYDSATVYSMQIAGNHLYYTCGVIAGSGAFFQGGPIQRVPLTGGDAQTITDTGDNLFYVEHTGETDKIYMYDETGEVCYYVETGEKTASDFRLAIQGKYFHDGPDVKIYEDDSAEAKTLITAKDYEQLYTGSLAGGFDGYSSKVYAEVTDLYQVGHMIYFVFEVGDYDGAMGWRTSYKRRESALIAKDTITGTCRIMNRY